ncbi:MAG: hypothetical protein JO037_19690 [Actinobacteria bacterium]|nr:hypothetical protein [Actinomycetota bacterium]
MRDTNDRAAASAAAPPGTDHPAEAAQAAGDELAQPAREEPAGATAAAQPGQDEPSELERLRAENERLREEDAKLRQQAGGGRRRFRFSWRATTSVVLIVLGCILAVPAVIGSWAALEVSNTDRYVATVEPLIHDPAIQNYLTDQITNQITSRLDITGVVNQASAQLNSRGLTRISTLLSQFGPQIASQVAGFVHSTVHSVIGSSAMAAAWVEVNRVAHQSVVQLLSGQGNGALSTKNGQIVLNLGPLIVVAKQDLVAHGFKLASNIPPVSPTLALFQSKDLGKAQSYYRLVKAGRIVLIVLTLLLLAAGVWVARGRRRALIGAGLGLAGSMLILGIALTIGRSIYLSSVPSSTLPSDAAAAAYDALVHFLRLTLRVVLLVGLVVAIGAFFTGPSRTAVQTRSGLKSGMERIRNFGERRGVSAGPAGEWTYLHRRVLRIGAVALIAVIFVFLGQPTVWTVIVLVIVLLVLLGLIELIGGRPPAQEPAADQAAS